MKPDEVTLLAVPMGPQAAGPNQAWILDLRSKSAGKAHDWWY